MDPFDRNEGGIPPDARQGRGTVMRCQVMIDQRKDKLPQRCGHSGPVFSALARRTMAENAKLGEKNISRFFFELFGDKLVDLLRQATRSYLREFWLASFCSPRITSGFEAQTS